MTFARYSRSVIEILFVTQPSLTAGFLFLFFWKPRPFLHNFLRRWDLLVLSAVIICLYMLVYLTPRYIGAFVVLLWFSGFMALRVLANEESHRVAGLSVIALVIAMVLSLTSDIAKKIVNGSPDSAFSHVEMAQQLMLPPDTAVAVVGRANFAYWAHLTQIRIVADIMATEEGTFWRLPADKRQELYIAFRTTRAQWIIAEPRLCRPTH